MEHGARTKTWHARRCVRERVRAARGHGGPREWVLTGPGPYVCMTFNMDAKKKNQRLEALSLQAHGQQVGAAVLCNG